MIGAIRRAKTVVIAEIGVNHNGSMNLAMDLIRHAHSAGANYAKFQTFRSGRLASREAPLADYQKASGLKESQQDLLQNLELSDADFLALKEYCAELGIGFLTTAHDQESAEFVLGMNLDYVKVPSGDITNLPFLEKVAGVGKPVLLSTGMASFDEVDAALAVLVSSGLRRDVVTVMQCTTEYPAPAEEANLLAMVAMGEELKVPIGYSDHTLGHTPALAAVALGARVIEKHLTTDKALTGPDHRASLEPDEFRTMVAAIRTVESSLGDDLKMTQPSEEKNKSIVRKSIVAQQFITRGEQFSEQSLSVMRPGYGISPMMWHDVVGQVAHRDFQPEEPIELP